MKNKKLKQKLKHKHRFVKSLRIVTIFGVILWFDNYYLLFFNS